MEPLKPCPFCGATASETDRHTVACNGCGASVNEQWPGQAMSTWNRRALLPAASGWVEVTEDPKTWPNDPKGRFIFEAADGGMGTMHGATLRRHCQGRTEPGFIGYAIARWHPWPAATPPAACAHGALLREAADALAKCHIHTQDLAHAARCPICKTHARLRAAAADAAGKEGEC